MTHHIFDEPKVDCHVHVFDLRFAFKPGVQFTPAANEISTARQLTVLMESYGVGHALLVGPNTGYDTWNDCLLDAVANGAGRFRGIAVVPNDIDAKSLVALKAAGVAGIAFNPAQVGVAFYQDTAGLLGQLAELDMLLQLQVKEDELIDFLPLLDKFKGRLVIDHCGRPAPERGLGQPGFQALLALGRAGRTIVKLSGLRKVSRQNYPHEDTWPYVQALLEAFTPDACVWGSDWPFLRVPERVDYGPVLTLFEKLVPDPQVRRKIFWETPRRVFGFGGG